MATRAVGLIATLVLTRFLAPEVVGEVAAATIAVMTANQLSIIGFGQFVIAKPLAGRRAVFHATVYNLLFAGLALAAVLVTVDAIASAVGAPGMVEYVPGMVLSALIARIGFVPARVLARDMRFRATSMALGGGEIAYAVSALALAMAGMGGQSIVLANIARALVWTVVCVAAVDRREWLTPYRLTRADTRALFRFGLPISFAAVLAFVSRRWDNLVFSALFGPAQMGLYNLAYNLADIPASHVGEHIGDVLLPSFARLSPDQRQRGLVRSTALLGLIVFPLAVGLGAIAPTLVALLFTPEWQGIAPLLMVLSILGVARPIGWTVSSYLQAIDRPRWVLSLEVWKVIALLAGIFALAPLGPVWSAAGVGLAFAIHSLICLRAVWRIERLPARAMLAPIVLPLAACAALVGAVFGARWVIASAGGSLGVSLAVEIAAGALAYVVFGLTLMPDRARELLSLLRQAAGRTAAEPAPEPVQKAAS